MPSNSEPNAKPIVASYCTTFLKPEMRHIYRQVTGLQRYSTFIMTRERQCEEQFPFPDIELVPRARKNFIKRFYLKYIRKLPPVYYRGELQVLIKMLKRRPADMMHAYFGHTGVHLLPFIQEWDKPCVVSFHGMDIQKRPQQEGYDAQMQELLQTVPLVLARSKSLMEGLERLGCPKEKLRLNRTGIPLEQFPFQQRPMPVDGSWRFVQACRLIAKKGLRTAIHAFAKFHEKYPKARYCIAGEGPMKAELEKLIAELGLTEAVELRGFLSQEDLAALYARSHIFLHPSEMPPDQNQEGVPNSMLEAMATGLPVVATTHGGIPEAVTHERTGLLVPERDQEALFQAMCQITAEPDTLYILGQAASRAVRDEFEQGKQIEKLESYYDEARAIGGVRRPREITPAMPAEPHSFAYLFERFPSFVQTFVYREAVEMVRQEMNPWLVSLRHPDAPGDLAEKLNVDVFYAPEEKELRAEVDQQRKQRQLPWRPHKAIPRHRNEPDAQRLFEAIWLGPRLCEKGIRHVHAHFGGVATRTAWWLRQLYGIGYSFTGHANDIFCDTDFPVSNADLVRDARFVVTETDYARRWMEEKYPWARGKVFRVFNGVAIDGFPAKESASGVPRIISVGRYVEKKGFDDLIRACGLLRDRGIDFTCGIVGGGPSEAPLQGQITEAKLDARVQLLGPHSQSEVRRMLAAAQVFVLACVPEKDGGSDNLPTVIMEAMLARTPVISTKLAGVPEMIDHGQDGLLVPPHDPAALAEAMEKLLADRAAAERLGQQGRASAEQKFAVDKTTCVLKHLLAERAPVAIPAAARRLDPSIPAPGIVARFLRTFR